MKSCSTDPARTREVASWEGESRDFPIYPAVRCLVIMSMVVDDMHLHCPAHLVPGADSGPLHPATYSDHVSSTGSQDSALDRRR